MSTLTTRFGVVWSTLKHNNKVAYSHKEHAICYNSQDKKYLVMRQGHCAFAHTSAAVCLEQGSDMVLDVYASHFKPSWER